jgi:osmoprotectant transport system permease protein
MGMSGRQTLWRVELPLAAPLIVTGVRTAAVNVIATATLAAVAGTGGLGRFLIDGQKNRDYPQMAGGAVLVAVLALVVDLLLAVVQRYVVSPGLTGRGAGPARGSRRRSPNRNQGNTPLDVDIPSSTRTVDPQTP